MLGWAYVSGPGQIVRSGGILSGATVSEETTGVYCISGIADSVHFVAATLATGGGSTIYAVPWNGFGCPPATQVAVKTGAEVSFGISVS